MVDSPLVGSGPGPSSDMFEGVASDDDVGSDDDMTIRNPGAAASFAAELPSINLMDTPGSPGFTEPRKRLRRQRVHWDSSWPKCHKLHDDPTPRVPAQNV